MSCFAFFCAKREFFLSKKKIRSLVKLGSEYLEIFKKSNLISRLFLA